MQTRRLAWVGILGVLSGALVFRAASAEQPPNILLIIADDQNWYDVGCYGNPDIKTPHIDRLAAEGMQFHRMFTATAMCAPTRQQLYTGVFPVRNGAYPNHSLVYPGTKSIAHYLKPLGYRVGLAGKTHFGPPEAFPFEKVGGSQINLAAIEAFIRRDGDQPYCLIVAAHSPHTPWSQGDANQHPPRELTIPPYLFDTPETRHLLSKYYAEITYLDGHVVGPCLKFVYESGALDNTIVLYTSEQGSPMLFGKFTCYDLGLKTAFLVRWPHHVQPGSQTQAMTQYVDVLPTLIEAAGGPASKNLDGRSFLSVLEGRLERHREHVYGVQTTRGIINGSNYPIRSIRSDRYKFIMNLNADKEPFHNVLTVDWFEASPVLPSWEKLGGAAAERARFYTFRPKSELYDVITDPWEQHNLAGQAEYAPVVADLKKRLLAWMNQQGDEGMATELKAKERQRKGALERLEKKLER